MTFPDLGRRVLLATITASLGVHVDDVDIPALVNAFVDKWGFVDLDEVPQEKYWELVVQYAKLPVK